MDLLRQASLPLLRRSVHARPGTWLGVLASSLLAGCFLIEGWSGAPGLVFSHRFHVQEQGLDCSDCHVGALDAEDPGMPVALQCALCHEDADAEKAPELQVASLFQDGVYTGGGRTTLPGEVIFSHLTHVELGGDCSLCHGEVAESDRPGDELRVDMQACTRCHERLGVASECATCHREIRQDRPPPSHASQWDKLHGGVARARSGDTLDDCALCHSDSSCSTCHASELPDDHTNFWRRRGHAQYAALDRERCSVCHESDSCNRCHSEAEPVSHAGAWGGTRSNHCLSCHLPLRAEGCFTCHKATPSHDTATPQPPNHFPGMNCRQCHGLTAPLPHVDNGADCTVCHH